ncbi:response regulator [Arthrobacter tecti]
MNLNSSDASQLTVHVAGGDYLSGLGLVQLLSTSTFVELTGYSSRGRDAVVSAREESPDILLLDSQITDHGALEAIPEVRRVAPSVKVVVLAPRSDRTVDQMEAALLAGACSFLVRDFTLEDIAAALRIAHRGGFVAGVFPRRKAAESTSGADSAVLARLQLLNTRDQRIVRALAKGRTNAQISREVHLSETAIKARLTRVIHQLGVENRVQLAVAAVQAGL